MRRVNWLVHCAVLVALSGSAALAGNIKENGPTSRWTKSFGLENHELVATGENEFFILKPGYQLVLSGIEDGDSVTLIITVLDETEEIAGVVTRIIEERESANGELVEVSRNFFAFCPSNGSVFYFGEDVDIYEDGEISSHAGAWRAGADGFKPGLMMPGLALNGSAYYQEIAPEIAMDRAMIISTDSTVVAPHRTFEHCLVTEESSDLEPGSREQKLYAPGIGLIKDGPLWLERSGMVK